jgi:hypothetical protein
VALLIGEAGLGQGDGRLTRHPGGHERAMLTLLLIVLVLFLLFGGGGYAYRGRGRRRL